MLDAFVIEVNVAVLSITMVSLLIVLFLFEWALDRWRYSPAFTRFRCILLGHDYHDGATQDLICYKNGYKYIYDFCQRCHTEQNVQFLLWQ